MDIGKAFTFVFEDEEWVTKLLIAAAIFAVGVVFSWLLAIPLLLAMAILSGYMVEIIRRVLHGNLDRLPEWDNWGDLIVDGLKVWVIGLVYSLPLIILSFCLGVPIGALAEDAEAVSSIFSLLLSCIGILYGIALSIVLPAATAFWVASDDLGAAFRFGDIFAFVRDNFTTYLITFLMCWVASFVGGLGIWVCGLGLLVTVPYSYMVTGHLYGQAYVESSGQASPPVFEEEFA